MSYYVHMQCFSVFVFVFECLNVCFSLHGVFVYVCKCMCVCVCVSVCVCVCVCVIWLCVTEVKLASHLSKENFKGPII